MRGQLGLGRFGSLAGEMRQGWLWTWQGSTGPPGEAQAHSLDSQAEKRSGAPAGLQVGTVLPAQAEGANGGQQLGTL